MTTLSDDGLEVTQESGCSPEVFALCTALDLACIQIVDSPTVNHWKSIFDLMHERLTNCVMCTLKSCCVSSAILPLLGMASLRVSLLLGTCFGGAAVCGRA